MQVYYSRQRQLFSVCTLHREHCTEQRAQSTEHRDRAREMQTPSFVLGADKGCNRTCQGQTRVSGCGHDCCCAGGGHDGRSCLTLMRLGSLGSVWCAAGWHGMGWWCWWWCEFCLSAKLAGKASVVVVRVELRGQWMRPRPSDVCLCACVPAMYVCACLSPRHTRFCRRR
jgi:hypothetical protein